MKINKIFFNLNYIHLVFLFLLLLCLFISFYIMVTALFTKDNTHNHIFSAWQFPMLLAIFIDIIYHSVN